MADVVSFRISTYRKLAKGETGLTRMDSTRLAASEVIEWVLSELPEAAVTVSHADGIDRVAILIDWGKVPGSIRNPVIPGRMRHLARFP